jgi:short-subunit dehydrogenase
MNHMPDDPNPMSAPDSLGRAKPPSEGPPNVLVLGATSAIAEATARHLAPRRGSLHLVGRDEKRLEAIADDLTIRGASSTSVQQFDASPDAVATRIVAAIDHGRPRTYAPGFWRAIMAVVRSLPDAVMQWLPL